MVGEGRSSGGGSSLVGCSSLCGWIDLARLELHHSPCVSLFFSRPGEVDSQRRAEYFSVGITATLKDTNEAFQMR